MGQLLLVGTYTRPIKFGTGEILEGKGKGIYAWRFDPVAGDLSFSALTEDVPNPSYLAVSRKRGFVYAVNELKEAEGQASGSLSAFSMDPVTGALTFLNSRLTGGTDPCYVGLDPSGRFAAVANYSSGSVALFPILEDGSLGEASALAQHEGSSVHPVRQLGPHAHSTIFAPDGGHLFVPDLGLDRVMAYEFDAEAGRLVRDEAFSETALSGAGPRCLEIHPSGKFAYTINELDSTVTVSAFDQARRVMRAFQRVSTLPPDFSGQSTCADLHLSPSGRLLYASNRGHDSLAVFDVDGETGALNPRAWTSTRGRTPRSFALDLSGRWLVVANQDTDNLVLFAVAPDSGLLEFAGVELSVPTPVCVKFA